MFGSFATRHSFPRIIVGYEALNAGQFGRSAWFGLPLRAKAAHAAHEVVVTGEIKDGAIVVSKIEMPKTEKK